MRKQNKWLVGIVLLTATVAIGAFLWLRKSQDTVAPRVGPVVEAVYGLGTVVAPQTYQVKTAVNQLVTEVFVKEGDRVKAGDALISFDESGIKRAPFAGTVTAIPPKRGEILFPSMPGLTLVNLNELYLEVSLEQQTIMRVKEGQMAYVSFENLRGEKLEGKVLSVFPRETQFIVKISLDSFPAGILPGMTADAAIEVGRKENVLSVPLLAVANGKITLRRQGKIRKESIALGIVDGEWGEVVSGNILPDDQVMVRKK
jgi:membrane fusion protein, macrolide-specific efflux system